MFFLQLFLIMKLRQRNEGSITTTTTKGTLGNLENYKNNIKTRNHIQTTPHEQKTTTT